MFNSIHNSHPTPHRFTEFPSHVNRPQSIHKNNSLSNWQLPPFACIKLKMMIIMVVATNLATLPRPTNTSSAHAFDAFQSTTDTKKNRSFLWHLHSKLAHLVGNHGSGRQIGRAQVTNCVQRHRSSTIIVSIHRPKRQTRLRKIVEKFKNKIAIRHFDGFLKSFKVN